MRPTRSAAPDGGHHHDRRDPTTTDPPPAAPATPGDRFPERLRAGRYRGLGEPGIAATIAAAAQPPGLADEIGVVRLALARLLEEEPDASRCAAGIARLAAVAVRLALAQRALDGAPDAWPALLARVLPGPDDDGEETTDGPDDDAPLAGLAGTAGFGTPHRL
ncbi:MAG: hypothetical protein IT337_05915 [Thermomicrobiales bacterium]|nr:hypothetical protein [Thermomicrobiales bacterium]